MNYDADNIFHLDVRDIVFIDTLNKVCFTEKLFD